MKRIVSIRTIWKINALLILVAGTGFCLMLGVLGFQFTQSQLQVLHRDDMVNVEKNVGTEWRLGSFQRVAGTAYLVAAAHSEQAYPASFSGKEATAIRNYLFVNGEDMSSRWLVPNNDQLFLNMECILADGMMTSWGDSGKPVKWLVFQVVTSDTDGDRRLSASDRMAVAVAESNGAQYTEVLSNVDRILGESWLSGDRLLVVHSSGGKHRAAEVNLLERKVVAVKELPAIN